MYEVGGGTGTLALNILVRLVWGALGECLRLLKCRGRGIFVLAGVRATMHCKEGVPCCACCA